MNRWPLSGSWRSTSRTSAIRLSGPLRPSTGCVATNRRTLGGRLSTRGPAPEPRADAPAPRRRTTGGTRTTTPRDEHDLERGASASSHRRAVQAAEQSPPGTWYARLRRAGAARDTRAEDQARARPRRRSPACPSARSAASTSRASCSVQRGRLNGELRGRRHGRRISSTPRVPRPPTPLYTSLVEGLRSWRCHSRSTFRRNVPSARELVGTP